MAGTAFLIVALQMAMAALAPRVRFGINTTDSLPGLVYIVIKGELPRHRGDIIAFRPARNPYYPPWMVFLKKAVGFPGDRVTRRGRAFFINGRFLGKAKRRSRTGAPLRPGPAGVLPAGTWFVWTPHPDSYDSRYADIGWIPGARILGRAHRLL